MGSLRETAESVSRWFEKHRRNLPWRKTSDPYAIWVSEVMLQQTQVSTVIPYYERFLTRFPNVKALAESPEEKVLAHWAGLGYYSRAKNLRRGAQFLLENHQGRFPRSRDEILKVPGIGPYTAGAVLSIAFDLKEPLVDGNVERVFSRYFALELPIDSPQAKRFFWEKADALVQQCTSARIFNQGLMELGSLICTKSSPQCGRCPLISSCAAHKKKLVDQLPFKKNKTQYKELHQLKLLFEKSGKIWLRKNTEKEWWSGLWDFPTTPLKNPRKWISEVEGQAKAVGAISWRELSHQKHTVTHHRLQIIPVHLKVKKAPSKGGKWVPVKEIPALPVSALVKKIMLQDF